MLFIRARSAGPPAILPLKRLFQSKFFSYHAAMPLLRDHESFLRAYLTSLTVRIQSCVSAPCVRIRSTPYTTYAMRKGKHLTNISMATYDLAHGPIP